MKIVAISDTHTQHNSLDLPPADMIIHAGDISYKGTEKEVYEFYEWFAKLPYRYKVFIAGNHDFYFEKFSNHEIEEQLPKGIIYLNDSGVVIEGLKIWGSPIQPWFYSWAFNRVRGEQIRKHWELIPQDTNILITHGPAYGVLDKTIHGLPVGCEDLMVKIREIRPEYFICGHIHEGYGLKKIHDTTFINASVLDVRYKMVNQPLVFEIK